MNSDKISGRFTIGCMPDISSFDKQCKSSSKSVSPHLRGVVLNRLCIFFMIISGIFLTSCNRDNGGLDSQESVKLINYSITSENSGTDASQAVNVLMEFSKAVMLDGESGKNLRITIGGNRIDSSSFGLSEADSGSILLKIYVEHATDGKLKISSADAGIYLDSAESEDGLPVLIPEIDALIPCGVELEEEGRFAGSAEAPSYVQYKIAHGFNIRSMLWVQVLEDGEVQEIMAGGPVERLDNAVAVHGHDFLTDTPEDIADEMAEILNEGFGDRYLFTAQGDTVTMQKYDGDIGTAEIAVYTYNLPL